MGDRRAEDSPPLWAPNELVWRCLACGEVFPRERELPAECPHCRAPATELVLVEED